MWSGAQADIDRITAIWRECYAAYRGPYLFGAPSMADAMYAPVVTRFLTYDVHLDNDAAAYCDRIMALPEMVEWCERDAGARRTRRDSTWSSEPAPQVAYRSSCRRGTQRTCQQEPLTDRKRALRSAMDRAIL